MVFAVLRQEMMILIANIIAVWRISLLASVVAIDQVDHNHNCHQQLDKREQAEFTHSNIRLYLGGNFSPIFLCEAYVTRTTLEERTLSLKQFKLDLGAFRLILETLKQGDIHGNYT